MSASNLDCISGSEELPTWTTQCGSQSLRIVEVIQADGSTAWDVNTGKINRLELYFPTRESAIRAFHFIKSIIEGNHQNVLQCCVNPDYTLGPTRATESEEEKLSYATPCARQLISVVRKTTMTGRDVWDLTTGRSENPVAMMYNSFESAKSAFESGVDSLKLLHIDCCIIPNS